MIASRGPRSVDALLKELATAGGDWLQEAIVIAWGLLDTHKQRLDYDRQTRSVSGLGSPPRSATSTKVTTPKTKCCALSE